MKTRRNALLLSFCAVLLVVASVFGTVAYMTSKDEVKNTFTVGKVAINLDEAKVTEDGKPVEGADRVKENSYKLVPGLTYTKDPMVTVLDGSEASYVRMKVTFNNAQTIIDMCTDPEFAEDGPTGVENAYPLIRMVNFTDTAELNWDGLVPDNMDETEDFLANPKYFAYDKEADTLTYYYYYKETVAAPNGDVELPVLFDGIRVPTWVSGDQLKELDGFQINVEAEAIQAAGFDSADDAWEAFA